MAATSSRKKQYRVLELPEIISGFLVLLVVLWEACFMPAEAGDERVAFYRATHLLLCGLVVANTLVVLLHAAAELWREHRLARALGWQLTIGLLATAVFLWPFLNELSSPARYYVLSLLMSFILGGFAIVNLLTLLRERVPLKGRSRRWSPAVTFFTTMLAFVLVSTLILLTPGAAAEQLSVPDAFFISASATAITGLSTVDISTVLTPLGKAVILADIQIGAIGVMTFSYFVLLMVGKRLDLRDSMNISGLLDQEGVRIIPSLIKAVIFVTLTFELVGAALFYFSWQGDPTIPQEHLWQRAVFHAVSSFCGAGIQLDSVEPCVSGHFVTQAVMVALMFAGTLGFGIYLEGMTRLRRRLAHKHNPLLWSTHSWLVLRVTLIVTLGGALIMGLLGSFEPSVEQAAGGSGPGSWLTNLGVGFWNAVGRSAGFTVTDISDYGMGYKLFLCLMMFIGGNPAGTGGGVYAPVCALCLLEVLRVLRGQPDVVLHNRRIARNTVERAMATVVLSIFWIFGTTMLLLLLEPGIAARADGLIGLLFEEVSAYTTTGYSLGLTSELSGISKFIISANMIFGRIGMFTFMLIFIRQREPSPLRYPVTRLPLN